MYFACLIAGIVNMVSTNSGVKVCAQVSPCKGPVFKHVIRSLYQHVLLALEYPVIDVNLVSKHLMRATPWHTAVCTFKALEHKMLDLILSYVPHASPDFVVNAFSYC